MSDNSNNLFNGIDRSAPISDIAQQLLMRAFNIVQVDGGDDLFDDDLFDDEEDLTAVDLDDDLAVDIDLVAVDIEGGSYAA